MIAGGRSPKTRRAMSAPNAVRSSPTRRSWASRAPGRDRQWRMAGRPVMVRQLEVAPEVRQLDVERREAAIRVETGLADGRHAWIPGHGDDPGPAGRVDVGRRVGMDADRRIEPREATGERHGADRRRDVPAGHEQSLDPGRSSVRDDRVEIRREPVGLEVAVGVDQAHALSRRSSAGIVGRARRGVRRRVTPGRRRPRAAGRAAPGRSAGRARRRGRPRRAPRATVGRRCRPGRTGRRGRAGPGPAAPSPA